MEPGTHCLRMRENLTGSRTNSVTWRGVVRRQFKRIASGRSRNCLICDFLQLKRLCNQSRIAKIPVIVYPLGLW